MDQTKRLFLQVDDVRLCCMDFGGDGLPVFLLHGLAGRGSEWRTTARWLTQQHFHPFALDQRGHGMSSKRLPDFSRAAYVRDAVRVIEQLELAPVVLIGQSMGALNALLTAAQRPDLVRALVVVEAQLDPQPGTPQQIQRDLSSWPVPFQTLADAREFFGGETLAARTWIEILEEHEEGYWPQFVVDDMVRSISDVATTSYRDEWQRLQCPTLVVHGEKSHISRDAMEEMARLIPTGRFVEIADAGHDVHLHQPERWHEALERFFKEIQLL
uniref:AB hydrolase-1 domain-containing protein n=1 Tax=Thermosporothrix sp. COM3 TaxID=2490863 RepID=A0A455SIF1_9CHLR|nr:hypothetical protein KTC_29780 [Thermosporothrix sp. COM3]